MLRSMAKIAARLDVDNAANRIIEGLYRNSRHVASRLARRFQVLAYHKVSPDPHPFFEPDHPKAFEQHMRFLSRCYRVMPLVELVERNRRGDIPHRAVAITFDDGYRDNYEYAFPILKKYGIPATPTVDVTELKAADYDLVILPGGHEAPDRVRQIKEVLSFVRAMDEAGPLAPDDDQVAFRRGGALMAVGRLDEGRAEIERARAANPRWALFLRRFAAAGFLPEDPAFLDAMMPPEPS